VCGCWLGREEGVTHLVHEKFKGTEVSLIFAPTNPSDGEELLNLCSDVVAIINESDPLSRHDLGDIAYATEMDIPIHYLDPTAKEPMVEEPMVEEPTVEEPTVETVRKGKVYAVIGDTEDIEASILQYTTDFTGPLDIVVMPKCTATVDERRQHVLACDVLLMVSNSDVEVGDDLDQNDCNHAMSLGKVVRYMKFDGDSFWEPVDYEAKVDVVTILCAPSDRVYGMEICAKLTREGKAVFTLNTTSAEYWKEMLDAQKKKIALSDQVWFVNPEHFDTSTKYLADYASGFGCWIHTYNRSK
jgi:hypothetical protein